MRGLGQLPKRTGTPPSLTAQSIFEASWSRDMKKLKFDDQEFDVVEHGGQPCLTLADVASALYAKGGDQTDTPL